MSASLKVRLCTDQDQNFQQVRFTCHFVKFPIRITTEDKVTSAVIVYLGGDGWLCYYGDSYIVVCVSVTQRGSEYCTAGPTIIMYS